MIDEDTVKFVRDNYENRKRFPTIKSLARASGVSTAAIGIIARRYKLKRRRVTHQEIMDYTKEHPELSQLAISEYFGVCQTVVSHTWRENGYTRKRTE